jgi:hypothetical protein
MKTRTQTRNVTTHGLGDITSFSIATNGKAFRSLIDSVYTDKVTTPIRELMTNAFDSHSAAGKGDEPFTVFVPTGRDLRFAVRDYGTGMDHDTVTNLYTTLFASSKEDTNDEVGQLGLGSKSPFAYTDTFTVTAFDGASKRVYTAFMASDLPQLALLHEGESTEPQGILVEFPVKYQDVGDFQKKVGFVALGFDVKPVISGGSIDIARPLSSGDGWKLYKAGYHGSSPFRGQEVYVRQGCVIYPVPSRAAIDFPIDYDTAVVIDVPIGTAEVTLSREALQWDDVTREGVVSYADKAWKDACKSHQEAYDALPRLVDKLRYRNKNIPRNWWGHMKISQQSGISLLGDIGGEDLKKAVAAAVPGTMALLATPTTSYGVKTSVCYYQDVNELGSVSVVLMDDSTPRRVSRVRQWGRSGGAGSSRYTSSKYLYLPVEGQAKAKARIQEVWGLKDEQFIPVSDLPDIDREVAAKINPTAKTVLQELQDKLDDGAIWVGTHSRRHEYLTLTNALSDPTSRRGWETYITKLEDAFPYLYSRVTGGEEVLYLSRAQRETLTVNADRELSNVMSGYIKTHVQEYIDIYTANEVRSSVSSIIRYEARSAVLQALNLTVTGSVGNLGHELVRGANLLGIDTSVDQDKVQGAIDLVRKTFPLLFPLDGPEMLEYIQKQAATLNQGDQS